MSSRSGYIVAHLEMSVVEDDGHKIEAQAVITTLHITGEVPSAVKAPVSLSQNKTTPQHNPHLKS